MAEEKTGKTNLTNFTHSGKFLKIHSKALTGVYMNLFKPLKIQQNLLNISQRNQMRNKKEILEATFQI